MAKKLTDSWEIDFEFDFKRTFNTPTQSVYNKILLVLLKCILYKKQKQYFHHLSGEPFYP